MAAISELEDEACQPLFARMRYRGINLTVNKEGWDSDLRRRLTSGQAMPFIFYLYVDDAAKVVVDMVAAGASMLVPAEPQFRGDLKVRVKDPFCYVWDIAQKISQVTSLRGLLRRAFADRCRRLRCWLCDASWRWSAWV